MLGGGWQTGQGEGEASQEGEGINFLVRGKFGLLQAGEDELIHRMLRPLRFAGRGNLWLCNGLKAPPLLASFSDSLPRGGFGQLLGRWRLVSGVGSSHGDPLCKVGQNLFIETGAVLGHAQILELVTDGLEKQTFLGFPWEDRRAFASAFQNTSPVIQD